MKKTHAKKSLYIRNGIKAVGSVLVCSLLVSLLGCRLSDAPNNGDQHESSLSDTSSAIPSVSGSYVFNTVNSMRGAVLQSTPPEGSYKKEISLAEYKSLLGFDPLPAYIPENFNESCYTQDADKMTLTFLSDGSLAERDLGRWACQFTDTESLASLSIEICRGEILHDYILNGELQSSEILPEAVLCKIGSADNIKLTAEFKLNGYAIFISAKNISEDEFIKVLDSYN